MGIKQILLKLLGEKRYLSLLAASFQRLFPTGRLGLNYQDVYFLKNIIVFFIELDYCRQWHHLHITYLSPELFRDDPGRTLLHSRFFQQRGQQHSGPLAAAGESVRFLRRGIYSNARTRLANH